jgi:hypothetical protein
VLPLQIATISTMEKLPAVRWAAHRSGWSREKCYASNISSSTGVNGYVGNRVKGVFQSDEAQVSRHESDRWRNRMG